MGKVCLGYSAGKNRSVPVKLEFAAQIVLREMSDKYYLSRKGSECRRDGESDS